LTLPHDRRIYRRHDDDADRNAACPPPYLRGTDARSRMIVSCRRTPLRGTFLSPPGFAVLGHSGSQIP